VSEARDDRADEDRSHERAMALSLLGAAMGTSLCAWLAPGAEQVAAFAALTLVCAVLSIAYVLRARR